MSQQTVLHITASIHKIHTCIGISIIRRGDKVNWEFKTKDTKFIKVFVYWQNVLHLIEINFLHFKLNNSDQVSSEALFIDKSSIF